MYNYDYEIATYESDEDYQNHFLQIFNTNDIMSDEVTAVLDEIYNLIKDDSDWSKLLCLLANRFFPHTNDNPRFSITDCFLVYIHGANS